VKIPSLSYIAQHATSTFRRFPFAILDAVVGTAAALLFIHYEGNRPEGILPNVILAATLGISLLTTVVVFGEKRGWSWGAKTLAQLIVVLLLAGYCFSLPSDLEAGPELHYIRFAILLVAMHLLTSAAPFAGRNEPIGFWQYNKTLFLRFLTAGIYSAVLWVGLIIAIEALKHLFGANIDFKWYGKLWVLVTGIFNTWFFLAGIPEQLDQLNESTDYPKGLKVFVQYILMPLIVIYLLILYAYMGKILVERNLPQGWVSKLILGFSITGILALLLVHPIKDRIENLWIRTVSKWYYIVLVPLDAMLMLAIWRRTSEYGFTVNRYIVIVLAFWLTAITIYFIVSKSKNIKVIPTSLCIIAFVIAYGPWSAFDVSMHYQLDRLRTLLEKNGVLVNGKVHKATQKVELEESKEISSIVRYLIETHGSVSLQPWFEERIDSLRSAASGSPRTAQYQTPQLVIELMGLDYVTPWEYRGKHFRNVSTASRNAVNLAGYEKLIHVSAGSIPESETARLGGEEYTVNVNIQDFTFRILGTGGGDSLRFDLSQMAKRLNKLADYKTNVPQDSMTIRAEGRRLTAMLIAYQLQYSIDSTKFTGSSIEADLLLGAR
jgi:hypothetical protein